MNWSAVVRLIDNLFQQGMDPGSKSRRWRLFIGYFTTALEANQSSSGPPTTTYNNLLLFKENLEKAYRKVRKNSGNQTKSRATQEEKDEKWKEFLGQLEAIMKRRVLGYH
mmetsp:Transcript_8109/g.12265  ORF Transcript_8109/g.12265 Transcript_8109/m.12265 type:complete len:110 (+) Transcript_8109:2-331(+)